MTRAANVLAACRPSRRHYTAVSASATDCMIAHDAGARLQLTRINAILRAAVDAGGDNDATLARVKAWNDRAIAHLAP